MNEEQIPIFQLDETGFDDSVFADFFYDDEVDNEEKQ
jgi:hypothetical protein